MLVDLIGDVIECNSEKTFVRKGNKVIGQKSTKEIVEEIHDKAIQNHVFYDRMYEEINKIYAEKKKEVDKLDDEMTKYSVYLATCSYSSIFGNSLNRLNLETEYKALKDRYRKAADELSGIYSVSNYAFDKVEESKKLQYQASAALSKLY